MAFRENSVFHGWTDWQIAREALRRRAAHRQAVHRRGGSQGQRMPGRRPPDTDRLDAIETRLKAVPDGWCERDGDAGLIENADSQPVAVLGTNGDVRLPLGEFLVAAPADTVIVRITEAEQERWLGEIEGLQVSLASAEEKLTQLDPERERQCKAIDLGMPTFSQIATRTSTATRPSS